jgi:hypothetical protein
VVNRVASLHEIETHWSLSDVVFGNEALDIQQELEAGPPPKE